MSSGGSWNHVGGVGECSRNAEDTEQDEEGINNVSKCVEVRSARATNCAKTNPHRWQRITHGDQSLLDAHACHSPRASRQDAVICPSTMRGYESSCFELA